MARTSYTHCKVCNELKEFTELFKCFTCKKICCIAHAQEELAFCPDCYDDMVEQVKERKAKEEADGAA